MIRVFIVQQAKCILCHLHLDPIRIGPGPCYFKLSQLADIRLIGKMIQRYTIYYMVIC